MKKKPMTTEDMLEWSLIALIVTCICYIFTQSYLSLKNNGGRTTNAIEISTKKK